MPKEPRNNGDKKAKSVAISGMLGAVAVLVMLMGGIIPIATFTAPMLAGLCLVPIMLEIGAKTALVAYTAVSLLSFLLVADKEMCLFFILLLGFYPILQDALLRIKRRVPRVLLKLAVCNLCVVVIYTILLTLLASPALIEEFQSSPTWFWAGMLVVGNLTFLLYDAALLRIKYLYYAKFKGKFFR